MDPTLGDVSAQQIKPSAEVEAKEGTVALSHPATSGRKIFARAGSNGPQIESTGGALATKCVDLGLTRLSDRMISRRAVM